MKRQQQSARRLLTGVPGLLVALLVVPAAGGAAETTPSLPTPGGAADLINVGGGLIAVIIMIIVLAFVYARTQGIRGGVDGVINIVASRSLGPKEKIVVVEVAHKQLLIGMTASSVQTLHVFDEPVAIAQAPPGGFAERLRKSMRGVGK